MRRAFITCNRTANIGAVRIAADAIVAVSSGELRTVIGAWPPVEKTVHVVLTCGKSYEVEHSTNDVFAMIEAVEAES